MIEIHGENGKIGEASLAGGTITATPDTAQGIADHMLRKHGTPEKAFTAMSAMNNGYVWAQDAGEKPLPSEDVTGLSRSLTSSTGREPGIRGHLAVAAKALDQGDAKTAYGALDLARRYATGEFGDNPERPVLLADKTEAWRSITQLRDSLRAAARNAE